MHQKPLYKRPKLGPKPNFDKKKPITSGSIMHQVLEGLPLVLSGTYQEKMNSIKYLVQTRIPEYIESQLPSTLQKIGVFGPFSSKDNRNVREIASYLVKNNCIAITSEGYYLPEAPKKIVKLEDILPYDFLKSSEKIPQLDWFIYSNVMPSIVDKAVIQLFPIRSNMYELEGCKLYSKQVMGYLSNEKVVSHVDECPWTNVVIENKRMMKECVCSHILTCPMNSSRNVNCIFHNPVPIPAIIRNWFIEDHQWKFYSMNDFSQIFSILESFI